MKDTLINLIKFVLFLLGLPLIAGVTVGFVGEVRTVRMPFGQAFIFGLLMYTVMHLFIYKPYKIFHIGQRLLADFFRFFSPLSDVVQYVLPLYTTVALALLYFSSTILKITFKVSVLLMFAAGFTLAMHVIMTAEEFSDDNDGILKANYLFTVGVSYIFIILLISGLLSLIFSSFQFGDFFNRTKWASELLYTFSFNKLFR